MRKILWTILCIVVAYGAIKLVYTALMPPKDFPVPYRVTIDNGQTLFSISQELYENNTIRSTKMFEMIVIALGSESTISEGEYYFESPVSVVEIAQRITGKQFGIDRKNVTFPEGFSNKEMANRLSQTFDTFDSALFLSLTKDSEGYLFPDTYGFFPSTTPDVIVATLKNNFENKLVSLRPKIQSSGRLEKDIVVMASIIEKEASGESDRALVSGILWNRIDAGIPLQVDAPFIYLLGKKSSELTMSDLATNSLYNTYIHKGFPPTPINNPGLKALTAAISPKPSVYFYYLHDGTGAIHFAKTYEEHKKNIAQYLK